ncbi:MAG TPA: hypothetical protein DEB40_07690 [Elusimicrobia bacterium]|nr:hypothetical protein [Elusimicrobiota bacterium]
MEIQPQDQKAILQLIERGVEGSAAKLAAISRTDWQIRTTSFKAYATPGDYAELKAASQYFFGASCQAPGKMFLALFTSRSAAIITKAFLAGSGKQMEATVQMQEMAIAEVANIVINAVSNSLADECGMAFILSAPKSSRGARADIIKAAFGDFAARGKIFSAYIHLSSSDLSTDCTLMLMLDDLIVNFILNALDR